MFINKSNRSKSYSVPFKLAEMILLVHIFYLDITASYGGFSQPVICWHFCSSFHQVGDIISVGNSQYLWFGIASWTLFPHSAARNTFWTIWRERNITRDFPAMISRVWHGGHINISDCKTVGGIPAELVSSNPLAISGIIYSHCTLPHAEILPSSLITNMSCTAFDTPASSPSVEFFRLEAYFYPVPLLDFSSNGVHSECTPFICLSGNENKMNRNAVWLVDHVTIAVYASDKQPPRYAWLSQFFKSRFIPK